MRTWHSQELKLRQFEHFRRQHSESVSVQLQHQQRAGDVVKAARLQDINLVVTQVSLRKKEQKNGKNLGCVMTSEDWKNVQNKYLQKN